MARSVRAAAQLADDGRRLGIHWPPAKLTLIALKRERLLEIWVANQTGSFKMIREFPILAASGTLGPKRKEGDRQVPEGVYGLPFLNPRSAYHLSILVDYPNKDDILNSKLERSEMGGEIFVHGKAVSIGCIAIGDDAIEQVYGIAQLVPAANRTIIICPVDFRREPGFRLPNEEPWVNERYAQLERLLSQFKKTGEK